jgi:hypothetical protein
MNTNTPTPETHGWTTKKIHDITEAKFGKRPLHVGVRLKLLSRYIVNVRGMGNRYG